MNGKYSKLRNGAHAHAIYNRPFGFSTALWGKKLRPGYKAIVLVYMNISLLAYQYPCI